MAKKTLIIDDLTGDTGAKTRAFRLDGVDYEIDLTDSSYAELKAMLKPYVRAARQVGGRVVAGSRRARSSKPSRSRKVPTEAGIIRAWARSVGMPVTERGRVAPDVRKAWVAAGSPR